ncbi:protein sel-1 homolog 2-like [Macaca nemestrina]|uniref:protein sel-1 homolog 2-like n=1 Tax=Macaca nemestrina TaxID=9545 RepID=UPI0039B85E81
MRMQSHKNDTMDFGGIGGKGWEEANTIDIAMTTYQWKVSANEIKQYLPHILEQRTSSNVINKRENLLEEKKNQCKIKGIQNKDILRNKNHLQKQAEKNFTDEGDQLFKMGIKVLQQSKSQKQKEDLPTFCQSS